MRRMLVSALVPLVMSTLVLAVVPSVGASPPGAIVMINLEITPPVASPGDRVLIRGTAVNDEAFAQFVQLSGTLFLNDREIRASAPRTIRVPAVTSLERSVVVKVPASAPFGVYMLEIIAATEGGSDVALARIEIVPPRAASSDSDPAALEKIPGQLIDSFAPSGSQQMNWGTMKYVFR